MSVKPPDEPQFNVCPNASRPGLVTFGIGTGTDPYHVTPAVAEALADELLAAAATARGVQRDVTSRDASR